MDLSQIMTFAGIIGFLTLVIGILVKIIGLPDQIKKNYKRKSTDGLSTPFMVLSLVAYLLWTIHGIIRKDMVLVFGQGLGIVTVSIILIQVYTYRNKK